MSGLVTSDFQWEFDGLLLGAGTPYGVTGAPGFLDLSGTRANFTPRARAHGGFTEPHFGGGAVLDIELDISATSATTFAAAVVALEANTYPQPATRPLWFQLPGHGLRTMQVQCLRRSIPLETSFVFGLVVKAALQFYAPDPLKYGVTQSVPTGLATSGGGLNYTPGLTYPLSYGAAGVTGRVLAANPGSAPASPLLTVVGPVDASGFQVTSVEDVVTLQYNGSLGASDTLVINTATGSVVLNGYADRRALLAYSVWPSIPAAVAGVPGSRTFAFSVLGAYQAAASLSVSWAPPYW